MNELLKPQNLLQISILVGQNLGNVQLTDDDNKKIIRMIRTINYNRIKNNPIQYVIIAVSKNIAEEIKNTSTENMSNLQQSNPTQLNTKENKQTLTKEQTSAKEQTLTKIDISKFFDISNKYLIQKKINPSSLYESNYIVLNTSNYGYANVDFTKISWNLMETAIVAPGVVNTAPISNLVCMRVFPIKFSMTNGFLPLYNMYNLLVDELETQAFIGYNNRKYHFVLYGNLTQFGPNASLGYFEMSPTKDNGKGYFWFDPPITTLKTFTISFGTYLGVQPINAGISYCYIGFTNPVQISPTNNLTFNSGDTCIISQFTMLSPTITANANMINLVNSPTGYTITSITPPSNFNGFSLFTIPLDLTPYIEYAPYNDNYAYLFTSLPYAKATVNDPNIGTSIPIELISIKEPEKEKIVDV